MTEPEKVFCALSSISSQRERTHETLPRLGLLYRRPLEGLQRLTSWQQLRCTAQILYKAYGSAASEMVQRKVANTNRTSRATVGQEERERSQVHTLLFGPVRDWVICLALSLQSAGFSANSYSCLYRCMICRNRTNLI